MTRVVGVVPHPSGWAAVALRDGAFEQAMLASRLDDIVVAGGGIAVLGVDVPLGVLPDRCRAVDTLAGDRLGPRCGSLYQVPPLAVWQDNDFTAANKVCRQHTGTGPVPPSLGGTAPGAGGQYPLATAPEAALPGPPRGVASRMAGEPLAFSKRTWTGQTLRRALLARAGIVLPGRIGPAGQAWPQDILDAASVGWSAHRITAGTARTLSSPGEESHGSPIAIWY